MDEREAQALKALREGTRIAQENGNMEAGMLVSFIISLNSTLVKLTTFFGWGDMNRI